MNAAELYLANRALIDRTSASVCRRNHASHADAEDFASDVHVHLIENNYAVLRAYKGQAEIAGFLHAVIRRLFQDWRNAHWGRWRPSAAVRREGPIAMLLETMLVRDKRPLDEAIEVLRANHGVSASAAELTAMAAQFPPRTMRSFAPIDDLQERADDSTNEYANAAANVERTEAQHTAERTTRALDGVLAQLSTQDQLILRMRFEHGAPVSVISRTLGLEQQPLYRHIERLLASVRAALEREGIAAEHARQVIAHRALDAASLKLVTTPKNTDRSEEPR